MEHVGRGSLEELVNTVAKVEQASANDVLDLVTGHLVRQAGYILLDLARLLVDLVR
jgi:hypothetical protein